jgi:hypothetical protein
MTERSSLVETQRARLPGMVRMSSALRLARSFAACTVLLGCGSSSPEVGQLPSHTNPDSDAAPTDAGPDDAQATEAKPSCSIAHPTSCPDPPVRYGDVEPIFRTRCVICHNNDFEGPWPLTDYQQIADWQDIVRGDLLDCSMPPADAGVPMTLDERLAILTWIRCALPQ